MAQKTTPKKSVGDDPRFAQAVQNYEAGLRAMQEHKFEKAKGYLQKVVSGGSKELADRASVHLNACNQQTDRVVAQFKNSEEHYDYAISLMNIGDYVSAREHLDKLSKQAPKADYVAYGLAIGLPYWPRRRFAAPSGRGHPPEPRPALSGAKRF
jgi:outer membrane protein assembly factor BamD (BamD/ComL family)